MNMKKYMGNKYLTVEDVKNSATGVLSFLNTGEVLTKSGQHGSYEAVQFKVMMDKEEYVYTPSSKAVTQICEILGMESNEWAGKLVSVKVVQVEDKEYINVESFEIKEV